MTSMFKEGLLEGRTAIVTGGGSGIGLAIAHALGELGAHIAICGRAQPKLTAAREALEARGIRTFAEVCDIRDADAVSAFVDAAARAVGPVDILVNNAGGQFPTTAESCSPRGWEAVVKNNLNGTFYVTQAVATRQMIPRRKGCIVNITANVARGFPGMVHTGAARAGVENLTKTLAVEWAAYGIRVVSVAPGIIQTTGVAQYPVELVETSRRRTPQKRLGTPEEVASLVVYLVSDAASFVTGVTWYVDGGAHLWGDTWPIPDVSAEIGGGNPVA